MKTILYLNGKRTTHKHIKELIGWERLDRYIRQSEREYFENPIAVNDYFVPGGILLICFE